MSPEELAALYPRLYHVTSSEAWPFIERHSLLSASELLELFGENAARRTELTTRRRPVQVLLHHPLHGIAVLTDNVPLIERSLAACLDDALTPGQWLAMLNARVFFWPDRGGVDRLLDARTNRGRTRQVLVFQTLELVRAHAGRVEISPINSGSTIHKPARRGLTTHTPLPPELGGGSGVTCWRRLGQFAPRTAAPFAQRKPDRLQPGLCGFPRPYRPKKRVRHGPEPNGSR